MTQSRAIGLTSFVYALAFFIFTFNLGADEQKPAPQLKTTEASKAKAKEKPKAEKTKGKNVFVLIETNLGKMKVELFSHQAPKTVENFVGLAEGKIEVTTAAGKKEKKR